MFIRGFPAGPDFVRIPRDDVTWAAFCRGGAPVYAPEFTYKDNFLPDHAGETYRGLDGLRRAWTGFVEPFEEMAYELERIVGSGNRVVSIHRVRTKARHTGIVQAASLISGLSALEGSFTAEDLRMPTKP